MAGTTAVGAIRREQILEAATRCFARRGFHGATMQEVCAEVGMSPGGLYRHFPSKEAIVEALVERDHAETVGLVRAMRERRTLGAPGPLAAALADLLRDAADNALHVEVVAEAARNARVAALARRSDEAIVAELAAAIGEAQGRGDVDPGLPPGDAAKVLLAVFDGLILRKGLEPEAEAGDYAPLLETLLARYLGPPMRDRS